MFWFRIYGFYKKKLGKSRKNIAQSHPKKKRTGCGSLREPRRRHFQNLSDTNKGHLTFSDIHVPLAFAFCFVVFPFFFRFLTSFLLTNFVQFYLKTEAK